MDLITIILGLCTAMWFIIDRFKELFGWGNLKYGAYITIALSALMAFTLAFTFDLDIVYAVGWWKQITTMGIVMTALSMMGGSSLVSKIAGLITAKKDA